MTMPRGAKGPPALAGTGTASQERLALVAARAVGVLTGQWAERGVAPLPQEAA